VLTQFTPRFQMPYPSVMACNPRHITHHTEHERSLVTIHALSRDLPDHTRRYNTRNTTVIPLLLLYFFPLHFPIFPLHLPIFPFDLLELVPSLSLVYINSATSRTHKVGKREAAFYSKRSPDPSLYDDEAGLYLERLEMHGQRDIPPLHEPSTASAHDMKGRKPGYPVSFPVLREDRFSD
jgi:hypothetical protein